MGIESSEVVWFTTPDLAADLVVAVRSTSSFIYAVELAKHAGDTPV